MWQAPGCDDLLSPEEPPSPLPPGEGVTMHSELPEEVWDLEDHEGGGRLGEFRREALGGVGSGRRGGEEG